MAQVSHRTALGAFTQGLLFAAGTGPLIALAQPATLSRISEVTLYPGSAAVERVAQVAAGARQLQLTCLPASFDVETLRLDAGAAIRIGDVSTVTVPRNRAAGCNETALDKRIAEIEDQIAAIDAESGGNDLALGFLRGLGPGTAGVATPRGTGGTIADTVQAVSATGQATLLKQHQLARRKQALDLTLKPLIADRDRLQRPDAQVRTVTIKLAAASAGELRMQYQIRGPGWAPAYRAALDTRSGAVRLERLAQVAQASGEDWRGIRLRLSTGQPGAAVGGPTPTPWQVGIAAPIEQQALAKSYSAAPAPRAMSMAAPPPASETPEVGFDVGVFQGTYATEFEVPGVVDLVSGEQRLTLSLGSEETKGTVRVRATPAADAHAYLVADIDRPAGVWPAGTLQLYRDGTLAGSIRWTPDDREKVTLPFGRDDRVLVRVEPQKAMAGSAGFIGGKVERHLARAYAVQNLHTTPVLLEVLEATPVSTDESVVVTQRLTPPPMTTTWQKQPGVAQWELTLEAGKTARFTADYAVTAPKDARLSGWR